MGTSRRSVAVVGIFCLAMAPSIATAEDVACAALASSAEADTDITEASFVEAGFDEDAESDLPAYCRVDGIIDARTGEGGVPFGKTFELRMPDNWNGRFYFQGGGGTDGSVRPAVGSGQPNGNPPALALGYAVVSTDAGHEDKDSSFGLDPVARTEWGYQAIHDVTVTAKALVEDYYGRAPHHSYLAGCSNGGRQGMVASQRFPDLFDGIVAGAPVFRMSRSHVDTAWGLQKLTSIAPKDDSGAPILSRAFSDADLALLSNDILAACDALDGLEDGMVLAVGQCEYDPARLQCSGEDADGCLTADQVRVLDEVHAGSHDSSGQPWYVPWSYDPGIGDSGWRTWRLGTSETPVPNAIKAGLSNNAIKHVFITPPDPTFDILTFDFDADPLRMEASAEFADATSTDLSEFREAGGKILFYHGVSDPAISSLDTARYYDALTRESAAGDVREFARLFLVPGMGHCRGGKGLDEFDALGAIVDWVENGEAPETLVTAGPTFPERTRTLCPYPTIARYDGSGDPEDAGSFVCE